MWDLLLKLLDWLRDLISGHIEKEKEQERIFTERLERETQEIKDEHDREVSEIPDDGDDLVEYWRTRGVHNKTSDLPPSDD